MSNRKPLAEAEIEKMLHSLDRAPSRSPERGKRARAEFLDQARRLALIAIPLRAPTSVRESTSKRKGLRQMLPAIASLILVLGLVLGGGGTVFAAQDALPTESLYPLKLWTEDAQVDMTSEADARTALLLQYADRRIAELGQLPGVSADQVEPVLTRYEEQLNAALRLAVEGTDPQLALRILARVQAQLEVQSRVIAGLQLGANEALHIRERLQTAVQQRLELCQLGQQNPDALREQLRDQVRQRLQDRTQMPAGNGPQGGATPEPNATAGSYGPGPGDQGGPGGGEGNSSGSGSSYGWGPGQAGDGSGQLTLTPTGTPMRKRYGN
jgi:Domain of unknown function (DUF5667)